MLVCCKDDDDASGSQEGSSGGRSHLVEQFTGVGIKVFTSAITMMYLYTVTLTFVCCAA